MARKNRESNAMTIMAFLVGVLLVVSVFALYNNGKITMPTGTPPVTTIPPTSDLEKLIPSGYYAKDLAPTFYNTLYDDSMYPEEADSSGTDAIDFYIFETNPLLMKPTKSVYCDMEVVQQAIKAKKYYKTVTNTAGSTTILYGEEIEELIGKGLNSFWLVTWCDYWGDVDSSYSGSNLVDWWEVTEIPIKDALSIAKGDNPSSGGNRPDYDQTDIGKWWRPEAIDPIGACELSLVSTTTTEVKIRMRWEGAVDASNDSNDMGRWVPYNDQPILIKIVEANYTAGDTITEIKYNGQALTMGKVEGTGTWYAYLPKSILGDDSDGSLKSHILEITYSNGNTDETFTVTVYAGAFAGDLFPGQYNGKYLPLDNPTVASFLGPELQASDLSAIDLY